MKEQDEILAVQTQKKQKIVFLGEMGVGKTSIIQMFAHNTFSYKSNTTVGVDYFIKEIQVNKRKVRLQLWDTAGQERYRSLIPTYVKNATTIVIVFDITNEKSFESVMEWYKFCQEQHEISNLIILANKIDLDINRKVSTEQGRAIASELKAQFHQISAKENLGISQIFEKLVLSELKKKYGQEPNVSLQSKSAQNKRRCCK